MSGTEWLVEAFECDPALLRSRAKLSALFAEMVRELSLHPVREPQWHQFPEPGGITGMVLLAESHITVHTFPEHGSLALNLFCCKPREEWDFRGYLEREFDAGYVRVRVVERPYAVVEARR